MSGKQERHGPDGPLNDLTGKAIVNDGPNEREEGKEPANEPADLPDTEPADAADIDAGSGSDGSGSDGSDSDGPDSDGFGSDELALRRMLRGAVEELEPSQNALDHLRKAVPARRARRRQAIVGMAAAALFVGTAVPAFVHVANSGDAADDRPSIAGHGQHTHGGTGWAKGAEEGKKKTDRPSGKSSPKSEEEKRKDKKKGSKKGSSGTGTGRGSGAGGADTSGGVPASSPACTASQLAVASAGTLPPDAEGKVYGTFRISNVSEMACVIAGRGTVYAQPMGAADPARINVVDHTSGDAAAGLPDPSLEMTGLLLEPDMAYEVKFAWVPTETCPTTDPSPDPTPPPEDPGPGTTSGGTGPGDNGGGEGAGGNEGEAQPAGTEPQLGTEDGGTADGSVSVSHTSEAGAPTAAVTVPNACAGTIYRTGVLPAS
ncbi:hypothetical protein [Streptomyces flavidovirens]|uniref:hypothetical protein n=1 Tax=Streptomyces flavidovirens TaxID=67298 RepID=UPI0036A5444B